MRNPRLLLYVALILAVLDLISREDAAPALPLVKADFQACTPIHNGPIVSTIPPRPFQRQKDTA